MNLSKLSFIIITFTIAVTLCTTGASAKCGVTSGIDLDELSFHELTKEPGKTSPVGWAWYSHYKGFVKVDFPEARKADITVRSPSSVVFNFTTAAGHVFYLSATARSLDCEVKTTAIPAPVEVIGGSFAVLA